MAGVCKEDMVALLFGKGVEEVIDTLIEEVGEGIMYWMGSVAEKEGFVVWEANEQIWSPPLPPL